MLWNLQNERDIIYVNVEEKDTESTKEVIVTVKLKYGLLLHIKYFPRITRSFINTKGRSDFRSFIQKPIEIHDLVKQVKSQLVS